MYYQGYFKPKNPKKYKGDVNNIVYRSSWELQVMKWCDTNPDVIEYSSEEVIIPYLYEVDKKYHRYYMDFKITYKGGNVVLVEIKPEKDTQPPKQKRKTKRYFEEAVVFVKNQNKWKAAEEYAKDRGWEFQIWTENTLKQMGLLKSQSKKKIKPLKKMPPLKIKKKK
jgi:hypothetical protein